MLESTINSSRSLKKIDELKVAVQTIWEELSQEHMNKSVNQALDCMRDG